MASSQSTSLAQDLRTSLETTGGGQFIGPGATTAQTGLTLGAQGASRISQSIGGNLSIGLSGANVSQLLDRVQQAAAAQGREATQLAASTVQALAQQKTGEAISLTRYVPYVLAALVLLAMFKRGQR